MNTPYSGFQIAAYLGTRPNVPKIWTLQRALKQLAASNSTRGVEWSTIHSQQHTKASLGRDICEDLGVTVDRWLDLEYWTTDGGQVAALIKAIEADLINRRPSLVVAVGDVNTALACAIASARLRIPLVHLEAGLRSTVITGEEVNRRIISSCTQFHLTTTVRARENLLREGVPQSQIWVVGNPMAECFLHFASQTDDHAILGGLGLEGRTYTLATVHKWDTLRMTPAPWDLILSLAQSRLVIMPCHPTARKHLADADLNLLQSPGLMVMDPLPYRVFGALLRGAEAVVTDSDGVQEESAIAGVLCLSLVDEIARPEILAGGGHLPRTQWIRDPSAAIDRFSGRRSSAAPEMWDQQVSARIAGALAEIVKSIDPAVSQLTPIAARTGNG